LADLSRSLAIRETSEAITIVFMESSLAESTSFMSSAYALLFGSPVNTGLTLICLYLAYKLLRGNSPSSTEKKDTFKIPPPLSKHNMTLEELRNYDGKGEDGRICLAILNKVYDVSKGWRFYGPEGPYCTFAGRDATRALATFDVNAVKDDYDDFTDLTPSQKSSVEEWEMQLSERYDYVGKLIRPGEDPEEEDDDKNDSSSTNTTVTGNQ
jgi:membrane-associated progesterone receptor component